MPEVAFKGIREGLLVSLSDGDWPSLEQTLYEEIGKQGTFLKGARLILDVDSHSLNAASMGRLRDQLADQGLALWAVLSRSPLTEQSAQLMGIATRIHDADPEPTVDDEEVEYLEEPDEHIARTDAGMMIRRTLRSGANISHNGHVTIIGDVNPGAQIIAGGNVVVWGRLRGMVHAGAEGDEAAIVCAIDLSPTQLRIAGHIAMPPTEKEQTGPEIAFVRDGQVVAEAWTNQNSN
jgi:septum site-determining protein MinC